MGATNNIERGYNEFIQAGGNSTEGLTSGFIDYGRRTTSEQA